MSDPSSTAHIKTVRVVIKGRVQGVSYRGWTVDNATDLGLSGWVRNRKDGTVEAMFSGSPEKVLEMERRCWVGPPAAEVTGVDVNTCGEDLAPGFECRLTV
uniref:acylphosphatase n=2 Tax=Nicotiana TaxID=4085 RepID=A0A1S4B4S7_TOBAC|nr:PREDICTED: acylphosphatase-2-like [Nicotiana sylvestris]XP_016483783.1 PREDICTED: acylphosphatase-like [Nicotiana tabacum]